MGYVHGTRGVMGTYERLAVLVVRDSWWSNSIVCYFFYRRLWFSFRSAFCRSLFEIRGNSNEIRYKGRS